MPNVQILTTLLAKIKLRSIASSIGNFISALLLLSGLKKDFPSYTQLGKKDGTKETYLQAREFDEHGKPIRDIDFTDHGRPDNHPNPHQHRYKENSTGGTRARDDHAEDGEYIAVYGLYTIAG